MNNYSRVQRILHRFALSSQFMREVMFDFEKSLFSEKNIDNCDNHVFVAGLARSGTTVLLNAIFQSNQFASLRYDDMPFILAPNLWAKFNPNTQHNEAQERAHGDGVLVSTASPEAFEEVFWKTFDSSSSDQEENFKKYIYLILKKSQKNRYLSKNNQNIRRLSDINQYLPESKILVPFRDPMQQANSLFFQHKKFIKDQTDDPFIMHYMRWIGHSEFGLDYKPIVLLNLQYPNEQDYNHWLEQWLLTYQAVLSLLEKQENIYLVCYESLCQKENVWKSVQSLIEVEQPVYFSFKETTKDSKQSYDKNLFCNCYDLYETLKQKSVGI